MSATTQFLKKAAISTTEFIKRNRIKANSSVLVGGFIGSASTAKEIIDRGIRGEPLSVWHAVNFAFFFTLACCHSHTLWKTDPNANRAPTQSSESEWLKRQLTQPPTKPNA